MASVRALLTFCAAVATLAPCAGMAMTPSMLHPMDVNEAYEDGLLFPDANASDPLADPLRNSSQRRWIKFRTDACGVPVGVESKRTLFQKSALRAEIQEYQENDPEIEAHNIFGTWLSEHPEIALVSDGVAKSCDDAMTIWEDAPLDEHAALALRPPESWTRTLRSSQIA